MVPDIFSLVAGVVYEVGLFGDHRFDQSVGARVVVFDAGAHMPELQVAQMTQRVGRLLMDFPRPLVQAGTTSAVRPSS